MQIRVDSNLERVARKYRKFGRQIPFAAAQTMNRLIEEAKPAEADQLTRDIDRPTPFTTGRGKRGSFMRTAKRASKRNLVNIQEMKRIQASYLRWQIYGGVQNTGNAPGDKQGRRILVPTPDQPRDAYGNVRQPAYRRVVSSTENSPQLWRKNQAGIFRKGARGEQFRFAFARSTRYTARYAFGEGYRRYVTRSPAFRRIFQQEIRKAIATAR